MKKNLRNTEENLHLELNRCKNQVETNLFRLKNVTSKIEEFKESKKIHHFRQLFVYYQQNLIPALEETIRLGKRHLDLIQKNPDKAFNPVKLEVKNHNKLMRQFFHRFNEVEHDFETFLQKIKKQSEFRAET